MYRYFQFQYSGGAFELFGPAHVWTVVGAAVFGALFVWAGRGASEEDRKRMRVGLAVWLMALDLATNVWWAVHGAWTIEYHLPLQLCTLMTWVMGYAFVANDRRLFPLIYFLGVGGALQALITPDAGIYGYPHFRFWDAMLSHSGLVVAGFWIVLAERVRPTARSLGQTLVALNLYALLIYFVNLGIGANYLYVNAKPEVASAMDLMPEWPGYIPVLEAIALVLFSSLYLPFVRWRRVLPWLKTPTG